MHSRLVGVAAVLVSLALVLGSVAAFSIQDTGRPQAPTPPPASLQGVPGFPTPPKLLQADVPEDELRQQLIEQKQGLCTELELIGGIITSTGILSEVPPMISRIADLPISELEARETRACQRQEGEPPDEEKTTAQLLEETRTVEWLVRLHLAAMDRVLMQNPTYRPINAEGSFRAFFEMHNISIQELRDRYLAFIDGPTLEEARELAAFWQDALIPHARAEEEGLFPLARSVGDEELDRSANLVEAEHQTLDEGIAKYMERLQAVERGEAQVGELTQLALDVRIRTELHFGKEEQSVIRPLQERITSEQFQPVVEEIDRAFGPWLRQHGWEWPRT